MREQRGGRSGLAGNGAGDPGNGTMGGGASRGPTAAALRLPTPPPTSPGFLRGRRGLGPGPVLRGRERPRTGETPGRGRVLGAARCRRSLWKAPAMAKGGGAALWYLQTNQGNNRPAGTGVIVCALKTVIQRLVTKPPRWFFSF